MNSITPIKESDKQMRPAIVLIQPRIPQNVGAVARLCAVTRAELHLVRPMPFQLTDKNLKRSGMDYLEITTIKVHMGWEEAKEYFKDRRMWFLTKFSDNNFHEKKFEIKDVLVFGSEEAGLPQEIQKEFEGRDLKITMAEDNARCLNLAMCTGICLYELLRQVGEL